MHLKNLTQDQINKYFKDWNEHTEGERLRTIRELRSEGILNKVNPPRVENSVQCPINGFVLAKPCHLSKCAYHIDSSQNKNCLVQCMSQSKNGRLSAQEVSSLIGGTVTEVNSLCNSATRKIRVAIIEESLERANALKFKYLQGHCVHCEQNILDDLAIGMDQSLLIEGQYGWCSYECRDLKPKWQFHLEHTFGCNFLTVVRTSMEVIHSKLDPEKKNDKGARQRAEIQRFETIDEALGLDPGMSLKIRNKYLSID